ncbi:acyl-CoA synthetase (AMP-forming)/AMP-acid ligase II [Antricoccus suffuscus]|uniref:Acyl-CoA synthetase (AMP-forming)/AMP-acid ligase II n=1 Tax=Antricoccus suffuscus TaxID=1629062 RepID=A0A2T1A798_9ACTN|nr:class I adenylate-forming enzyme family protein [Antricoccus suffuscus]PRZ44347.1 acyl-CoA synthetase (AMP-forming)/AMP-acid ligase II [Antricoccus suffuscus]
MIHTELIQPIDALLKRHAAAAPSRVAFRDERREATYADLILRTGRLAGSLQALGIETGERALIYMDNCVEVVEAYLALPRAGLVAVCANPGSAAAEIEHILSDSQARIVFTDQDHLSVVRALAPPDDVRIVVVDGDADDVLQFEDLAKATDVPPARDSLSLDDVSFMLYTSGTTGRPKGVYLTQRGCLWIAAACWAPILGLCADDYILSPLPLFHSYALVMSVTGVLAVGATERIMRKFSPDQVIGYLESEDITFLPGVPTMFNYLLQAAGDRGLTPKALRMCISAGAIMPAALNEKFESAFHIPLLDGYGITETSTMVTMNWPTGTRKMGSCGLPLPGSTVRLIDPATGEDAAPGAEGEIWVQGPHVAPGYHQLSEATAAAFAGGWYHTGDLAQRDEDGFLTISGRIKELIIRGGENIYPAEVEAALMLHDSVADAAVVSRPHEALGEVPVAFIVPAGDGLDIDALKAHCATRLAAVKVPSEYVVIDAIPRTGSGKVLRFKLQERLEG